MATIRRDGAYIQRQRIHAIAKDLELKLRQNGGILSLKTFQAHVMWEYGLNSKTTRTYLHTLELLQKIRVDDTADQITEFYELEEEA